MRNIIYLLFLLNLQLNAQQINWVKQSFNEAKRLGTGTSSVVMTPNGNFFHFNNYGTSAQTDTGGILFGREEANTFVSYMNPDGAILQQFNIEGIDALIGYGGLNDRSSWNAINDSEIVFLSWARNVYINGVKKVDSLVFNSFNPCVRLYKLSNTGALTSILTIPIWATGTVSNGSMGPLYRTQGNNNPISMSVDVPNQRVFFTFSGSQTDTLVFDTSFVKPNTTAVFQVSLSTGMIEKHWIFPQEFDGVSAMGDDIILSGRSQGFNYNYSINGISYSRDSTADLTTNDIVIASFNTQTGLYNWHRMFKVRSPYDRTNWVFSRSIDQKVYLQFQHQDTLTIDGVQYGSLIPFNTQEYNMVLAIGENGIKWANDIKGGRVWSIFKATHQESGVSYWVDANSDLFMNGIPLNKTTALGPNYLAVTESGEIDRSYNASFVTLKNQGDIFGVDYTDSTLIIGLSLYNADSLMLKGRYYTKKNKSGYFAEDLLISFKSSPGDVPTGISPASATSKGKIQVYPNPANTQLKLAGIYVDDPVSICIYDMMGKQIINKKGFTEDTIDISALAPGGYFVQISADAQNQTVKLIVD